MTTPLGKRIAAALSAVIVVVATVVSGVLPYAASVALDDAAQLVAGGAATVACLWVGVRHRGAQRRWRLLMGAGMACWTAGMAMWATYRSILGTPLPSPSFADFGFFLFPVFAVPALLAIFGQASRRVVIASKLAWVASVLDGTVIVGALFVLSWATVLGHVARQDGSESFTFLIALMYPVTDLVLVSVVAMLALVPSTLRRYRTQLTLLGSGIACLAVSDSIYAYLVAVDAGSMPLVADAGFIAGPVLIALAASTPADNRVVPAGSTPANHRVVPAGSTPAAHRVVSDSAATTPHPDRLSRDTTQLLVPYALLTVVGIVVAVQWVSSGGVDPVVLALFLAVVVLSLLRQVVTLLQNHALLRRLSDAQAELLYRAHHDGLTGLLNRSAFDEHLGRAIERHNTLGEVGVLLLIDLDDFKGINDRLGHGAGDRSLETLARRLTDCVERRGEGGIVARFGGDEFTVLIPAGIDTGCAVGRSIVDEVRLPMNLEGRSVSIGASVGVVELDVFEKSVTADTLLRNADRAMYEAKKNGKAGVFAYDSDGTLRMVHGTSDHGAPFDWFGRGRTASRGQANRGTNPNMVAGDPDPARLIGPPTRT